MKKWIIPSVVLFFVVTGGVYQLAKRKGVSYPSQGGSQQSADTAGFAGVGTAGVGSTSPGSKQAQVGQAEAGKPGMPSMQTPGGPGAPAPGLGATMPPVAGMSTAGESATTAMAPAATPGHDQCLTMTYTHKALASHPDEESCSRHKNLLKLAKPEGAAINGSSICVRVGGKPVHYLSVKGHPDEIVIGSVAGPKSKVTVRYCTGKAAGCAKEDCTIPKDEFMEAIGGSEGGSQNAKLGQWDPSAPAGKEADVMAKLDGEVKRELETNMDLNGRAPAGEIFRDWIGETQASACGTAQAKN